MAMNMAPQSALQQFMNTPQYALGFGANGTVNNATLSPQQRFQADPGYQYQQDEAMRAIKANYANKGLIDSGGVVSAMGSQAQQLANQQYDKWYNNQQNMYGQYMSALNNVMGNNANQIDAQLHAQQGNNQASLQANQGMAGMGAMSNTGAAMAGMSMEEGAMLAQLQAAQMAAQGNQAATAAGSAFGLLGSSLANQGSTTKPGAPMVSPNGSSSGGGGSGNGWAVDTSAYDKNKAGSGADYASGALVNAMPYAGRTTPTSNTTPYASNISLGGGGGFYSQFSTPAQLAAATAGKTPQQLQAMVSSYGMPPPTSGYTSMQPQPYNADYMNYNPVLPNLQQNMINQSTQSGYPNMNYSSLSAPDIMKQYLQQQMGY